jgi:transcriptional regulator with XRE-family HTH domain
MPPRFAIMLKQLRAERRMSQIELARRAKVAQGYISALEAGQKKDPGLMVLKRLARALGVQVTELLE